MEQFIVANLPIIAGGGVALVFFADLIGNAIAFNNRGLNAMVTAIIAGGLFFAVLYFVNKEQIFLLDSDAQKATMRAIGLTALGVQSVFVADTIGNSLVFSNRIGNAVVTAILWAAVFVGTMYALKLAL